MSRLLILAVLGSDPVSMALGLIHGAEDVKRGAQASCHIWQASHLFRPLLPSSISQAKRRVGIAEREGEGANSMAFLNAQSPASETVLAFHKCLVESAR
jgi:hypothetical protein